MQRLEVSCAVLADRRQSVNTHVLAKEVEDDEIKDTILQQNNLSRIEDP
jgi:hypothetical protein